MAKKISLEEVKAIGQQYDRGLEAGFDLGATVMCDFRNIVLNRIKTLIEQENYDHALILINHIVS